MKYLNIEMVHRMIFERGFHISSNALFESVELEKIVIQLDELEIRKKELYNQLGKLK